MGTPIGPTELGRWYRAYSAAMALLARQWLEPGAADDVVQDVFVRLATEGRPPANVKGWLFQSARNAAVNRVREDRHRRKREEAQAARRPEWFLPASDNPIEGDAVQQALESLPSEERELVALRIWAGMTFQEIAATVGAPVSTVHTRYVSALAAVRRRLGRL